MFTGWKERLAQKRAKNKFYAESQHWKNNPRLRECLQAMRGSCTVAPVEMHEAAIAAVNIALRENTWTRLEELSDIPGNFFPDTVFIVWDDERLPVLKAPWHSTDKCLPEIRAVACQSFMVSETLDSILWFDSSGGIKLYSIA